MRQFGRRINFNNKPRKIRKPLISVKDFSYITEPKAELLADMLDKLKAEGRVLIIVDEEASKNENLIGAAEGLDNVRIVLISEMISNDVKGADCLIVSESAINEVTERFSE